jgi:hypothetical protein
MHEKIALKRADILADQPVYAALNSHQHAREARQKPNQPIHKNTYLFDNFQYR